MKGWIEVGQAKVPIVSIELHQGLFTVIGRTKGPQTKQDPQFPVIVGHDGIPIYTCSRRLDVPKVGRGDDLTLTLHVTLHSLGQSVGKSIADIGQVFT